MAKQKTKNKVIEITIKMKGCEPSTLKDLDLKQTCWDCITELEQHNPQTLEEFGELDLLDDLLQSYFTLKLLHTEQGLDITDEMADIENFITKYLKRFYAAIHLEELNNLPPAFAIQD